MSPLWTRFSMEEFLTLRSRRPASSADSTVRPPSSAAHTTCRPLTSGQYGSSSETSPLATHDISRVSYHVKHLESFAEALQEVPPFPSLPRQDNPLYSQVRVL